MEDLLLEEEQRGDGPQPNPWKPAGERGRKVARLVASMHRSQGSPCGDTLIL